MPVDAEIRGIQLPLPIGVAKLRLAFVLQQALEGGVDGSATHEQVICGLPDHGEQCLLRQGSREHLKGVEVDLSQVGLRDHLRAARSPYDLGSPLRPSQGAAERTRILRSRHQKHKEFHRSKGTREIIDGVKIASPPPTSTPAGQPSTGNARR